MADYEGLVGVKVVPSEIEGWGLVPVRTAYPKGYSWKFYWDGEALVFEVTVPDKPDPKDEVTETLKRRLTEDTQAEIMLRKYREAVQWHFDADGHCTDVALLAKLLDDDWRH